MSDSQLIKKRNGFGSIFSNNSRFIVWMLCYVLYEKEHF